MQEGRDHSIKEILCREYAFSDFVIPVGGVSGQILQTWNPLDIFLSQPNVMDKIEGFAYLRSDFIIRLEFTTLPTVSGGVMLSFYPDLSPTALVGRIDSMLQLSQVPNVQQSLTTAVSMKIRVPWISPFYARDLHNGVGNNGTVILSRLTPSTIGVVAVKAYISAEESSLKLQYPTPGATFVTPLNRLNRARNTLDVLRHEDEEGFKNLLAELVPSTESNREAKQMQGGIISGILGQGSKIAQVASGIPGIGAVASAAAPLLAIGSNLAAMFGLSKPLDDKPITAVKIKPSDSQLTSEGIIPSNQFTINSGCSVDSSYNPFGSGVDEMATEAIMKTPNILGEMLISTAMPARYVVAKYYLTLQQYLAVNTTDIHPTHQFWLSNLFNQWNASLNFDFDLYLTHFHRVKLRFLVLPNYYDNITVGSLLPPTFDINLGSSAVVEFSGDNVNWSVRIDPRSVTSMKNCANGMVSGSGVPSLEFFLQNLQNQACSYGQLVVVIEVPLQAAATVSPIIYGITSFSADNVELTNPKPGLEFLPITQSKTSTLGTSYAKLSRSERMIRGSDMLVSNSVPVDHIQNVKVCAGDACVHLRNLLNAFVRFMPRQALTESTSLIIRPDVRRSLADPGNAQYIDYFDYLTKGYAFYKGSINLRYAFAATNNGRLGNIGMTSSFNIATSVNPPAVGYSTPSGTSDGNVGVRMIPVFSWEACFDINVPFYQAWHMVRTNVNNPTVGVSQFGEQFSNFVVYDSNGPQTVDVYRAAGDDLRMGFLMSLPVYRIRTNKFWVPA